MGLEVNDLWNMPWHCVERGSHSRDCLVASSAVVVAAWWLAKDGEGARHTVPPPDELLAPRADDVCLGMVLRQNGEPIGAPVYESRPGVDPLAKIQAFFSEFETAQFAVLIACPREDEPGRGRARFHEVDLEALSRRADHVLRGWPGHQIAIVCIDRYPGIRAVRIRGVLLEHGRPIPGDQVLSLPSQPLRLWCRSIRQMLDTPVAHPVAYRNGFCQCEVDHVVSFAGPEHGGSAEAMADFAAAFFWSVWIDQVMFYVSGHDDYSEFRSLYPFPKLYSHHTGAHNPPASLIVGEHTYPLPCRVLLLEQKKDFWGEVSSWLDSSHRSELRRAAISAFKEDLRLRHRFPLELGYLFGD